MASVSTFHAAAGTDDASWEDIMLPRGAREPPPVPRGPRLRYYLTTTSSPGQKWVASLVVSRVRAAGIEEDEKDMRKRVTRLVRERRKAHLNAKASTVPAAQLVVAEEAASSAAWRRNDCGLLWASGHRGRPDAKSRKLMAASSTAQPPGVVKTLTDDKKRKRPVKKRRGKKLTVAESEAEAEAARSSKRRVPRARKNKQ
eukprot:jgi/Tetstr1/458587/TSEL_044990.t1